MSLFEKYIQFLIDHPDMVNSIILWTMTMATVWFIMFKYRLKMIAGSEGANKFWEMPEQVGYMLNWVWPPVLCFSAYFKVELPVWVWYFMAAGVAYTVGGRWLFEWVLALRAGKTSVEESSETKQVQITETHTETTK